MAADVGRTDRNSPDHVRIEQTARDVVNPPRTRGDGRARDRCFRRIDGDIRAGCDELFDHGENPRELDLGADGHDLRVRRLTADVEDIGAIAQELQPMRDRGVRPEESTAVRERIGRDINHAHHEHRPIHRYMLGPYASSSS